MVTDTTPQEEPKVRTNVIDGSVVMLRVDSIEPDPDQPRKTFSEEGLDQLALSMATNGQRTAIEVMPHPESTNRNKRYRIIAGERRWRAANRNGWERMKAIVYKDISEREAALSQLLENIVREDLNPVEEARAFQKMTDEGYSLDDLSDAVGMANHQVAWRLQMLHAIDGVLDLIADGTFQPSTGLAMSKLNADQQERALLIAQRKGLNHNQIRILCQRIADESNVVELLGGSSLTEEQQKSAMNFQGSFKQVCKALEQLEAMEEDSPGSAAASFASIDTLEEEVNQLMQGLNRLKKLLHTRKMDELVVEAANGPEDPEAPNGPEVDEDC